MEFVHRTLVNIIAVLLLISSICNGNTPCSKSNSRVVNVTEDDLAGGVLLDISDPLLIAIAPSHEMVLLEYFADSLRTGRIEIIKTIDRDDIASRIGRSFDHVQFTFEYITFRSITNITCDYVTLHVNDLNDEVPSFGTESVIVTIPEERLGSEPLRRAVDRDEGINSTCKYSLVDDLNGLFELDVRMDDTGYITQILLKNTVPLDRENVSEYFLQLRASEGTADPHFAILDLNVTVSDICDNSPKFVTSRYFPQPVPENSPSGTVILNNITAYDADFVDRDGLTYEINDICRRMENNSPTCQTVAIGEYPFMLNTESGLLTLNGELDREEYARYEVSIHATDQCSSSATATVVVMVEDVNDNCPEVTYTPSGDSNEISENLRNLPNTVGFFEIRDRDSGNNGLFSVDLFEEVDGQLYPSDTFSLDENIGLMVQELVLVQRVDREMQNEYSLVVRATDFGSPNCTESFTLTIRVTDSNDNPPIFQPIMPVYDIQEELGENYVVVTLVATDRDAEESGSGLVTYGLPDSNETFPHQHLFKVENTTGMLKLATSLDREVHDSFSVLVVANDNPLYNPILNDPTFSDFIIVNITLIDINDNPPIIHYPVGTFEVPEDYPPSTVLFSINATDSDTPPHSSLTYHITSDGPFSINENNGMVFLNENGFNFEDVQQYELNIRVTDTEFSSEEDIIVVVSNVNDEPPQFVRQPAMYTGNIQEENQVTGEIVETIDVTDPDTPAESLRLQIETGNERGHFTIDPISGVITTTTSLDKEDVANYTLSISVTDGKFFAGQNAVLFIAVLDINDNPPMFVGTPYNFEVMESYPPETIVRGATEDDVVHATDLDTEMNAAIAYVILGATPTIAEDWFSIDENTGQIRTKIVLDREDSVLGVDGVVMLSIEASNPMLGTSRAIEIVQIRVVDINDEFPFFDVSNITKDLSENHETGAPFLTVQATDRDQPPFNEVHYSILNSPPGILDQFFIHQMTGEISLLTSLDHETQDRIEFQVQAQDANIPIQQVTQTIIINVIDAPDPCLKLINFRPFATLQENSPLQTPVVSFEATNLEGESVSSVVYTLTNVDGSPSLEFDISEDQDLQATVHTAVRDIDREALISQGNTQAEYRLNITAHDMVSSLECVTISSILTITILDENDNPPEFSKQSYEFSIVENRPEGSSVGSVSATDADLEENGVVTYSILQTENAVPFSIDNDGEISSTEQLDHDLPSSSFYVFTVIGQDSGLIAQSSTTTVRVEVLDANDNSPEFDRDQNHTFVIPEDASVNSTVATIIVSDADSGTFGEVTVSLNVRSNLDRHFQLLQDGSIRLVQELDREREDLYSFEVQAQDGGGRSATAMIRIVVSDVNDNAPVFNLEPIGVIVIAEDYPTETNFTNVTAIDADIGLNGEVYYELADESLGKIFCIHKTTGHISICSSGEMSCERPSDRRPIPPIDYERQNSYEVTVLAYDQSFPRHFVSKTINIAVTNVNEHAPEFDSSTVLVSVDEGQNVGTEVIRIQAYDWDYDSLTYSILESDESSVNFRYQDGAIVTSTVLDYNVKSLYFLSLRAQELNTEERHFGSILVEVLVNNINNHQPVFNTLNYTTSTEISELTAVGSTILTVYATDPDNATHDAVSYEILSGNEGSYFSIDNHTGDISVSSSLDYDSISSYVLTVVAKDTGYPQRSSTSLELSITLRNVNDESPIFTNASYEFELIENSQLNVVVGQVEASDRDRDPFGNVKYSLPNGANNYFNIDENSGEVFSLVEVDREGELASMFPVVFTVDATDSGQPPKTARTQVTVNLVDANDNPPVFYRHLYYTYIIQNQVPGVSILNLGPEVTDRDQDVNSEFLFEIRSQPQGDLLEISNSGQVMLKQSLPESPLQLYEVTVRATDRLDPAMYNQAIVRVVVEADNEHHPRFDQVGGYSIETPEDTDTSSSIIDMSEHVSDSDSNSQLSFQFQQSYPKYSIDTSSGIITLRESLDYEDVKTYSLIVEVTDNTHRTAETTVTVSVTGVNDNSPVFDSIPSTLVISRVPEADIDLFTVRATDADEGSDGIVSYLVLENGEISVNFDINRVNGTVKSKGSLNVGETFNLTVTALDGGEPFERSEATIVITIHEPAVESVPSFQGISNPPLVLQVNEDRENGMLFQLNTFPSAEGYAIVRSDAPSGLFVVASSQGRLMLQGKLNYRERSEYELVIEAYSQDTEDLNSIVRYSSYLSVHVQVVDVNDNFPQFVTGNEVSLSEATEVDSFVFTVYAFDEDSGINSMLNYEISGGNFERVFNINATSGEITLGGSLDRETRSSYDLLIRAFDLNTINTNFQEMTLHIDVLDENDYSPRFMKDGNYSINVYEYPHTKSGAKIVRLGAIDLDEGPFLRYDLFLLEAKYKDNLVSDPSQAPSGTFEINRDSGLVSVSNSVQLDYEAVDYYLLRIEVSDSQTTATTYLEVRILDVNDHSPEIILEETTIEIWEQQPIGSIVTDVISSSDVDRGVNGLVTFSLGEEWSQVGDTFMIDPYTGVIRVKNTIFFRPSIFTFRATIHASDQGSPPRNVSRDLNVQIYDVNDNSPVFDQQSYVFPISINAPGNSFIGTVTAEDNIDYRENSAVSLMIPHYYSEARRFFSFNTGTFRLLPVQGLEPKNYTLRVQASSPSFCPACPAYNNISYTDVTVVVYPSCPEFLTPIHSVDVLEGQVSQEVLLRLYATSSVGRQVEYFINDTLERPFTVDRNSGQLTLSSTLDRESVDFYEFFVAATDSEFQPLTCSAVVRINVLDINDNKPIFQQEHYYAFVQENLRPPATVATVSAIDLDLGANSTVQYELAASPTIPFTIDRQTGKISTTASFDAEDIVSYQFQVRAVDNGVQRQEGFVNVTVTVTDENEFPPRFTVQYTFADITPIRYSTGAIIGTVRADDDDETSQLTYSFVNEAPKRYFEINNRTGDIILIASQSGVTATITKRSIQKRQTDSSSDYFQVNGVVLATDGVYNVTTDVQFSIHNSFMPVEPFDFNIIIIVVVALVVAVIAAFVLLLIVALVCRHRRISRKVQIKDSAAPNNMELGTRFSSRRSQGSRSSTPSQYRQTNTNKPYAMEHKITTLHHSSGSGSNSSRQSYANYADDEMDSNNGDPRARTAYHSPDLPKKPSSHPSPRTRSTSDLASSVGTDMLGSQQLPHPKARIAAIYAAHHGLLNNHGSQDSIHSNHTFASEGGGEADAEADIENMLYSKYEFEDDEDDVTTIPDDSSYIGKERQSLTDSGNLNVPPVEEDMPPYSYSQTVSDWVPRATPMEHAIDELNELASYPSTVSQEEPPIPVPRSGHYAGQYDHSQAISMYGASSQGSRISLLRHHNGGHSQPRHFDVPPQMAQPLPHEYNYYHNPSQDHRYNQQFQGKQRYGSANALSGPQEYSSVPPRELRGEQHLHSSRGRPHHHGLSQDVPSTYLHNHDVPSTYLQSHDVPPTYIQSQDVPPTYLQNHYLPRGVNTHTPSSDTPSDGTVTPHRAMAAEYDHEDYLSSSSTSIGSTNLSGTTSSIGHSASQRMYQK